MPRGQFSAYQDWSTQSYHMLDRLTKVTTGAHLKFEKFRTTRSDSSNHSHCHENEGNFGGNQLLDSSIGLSLLSPSTTHDLLVSIATPPGFPLTLCPSQAYTHTLLLKPHAR